MKLATRSLLAMLLLSSTPASAQNDFDHSIEQQLEEFERWKTEGTSDYAAWVKAQTEAFEAFKQEERIPSAIEKLEADAHREKIEKELATLLKYGVKAGIWRGHIEIILADVPSQETQKELATLLAYGVKAEINGLGDIEIIPVDYQAKELGE